MMMKKIPHTFLRATLIGTALLLLNACGGGTEPAASTDAAASSAADTVAETTAVADVLAAPVDPALNRRAPAPQPNESGQSLTFSTVGFIDNANPFFKPFGNGRSCATCHQPSQGWSITPAGAEARFVATNGNDPLFRLVDGANSPQARVTTIDQRRLAYSMLLTKGLIRVGMPIPDGAEFELLKADDPYGYASARELSLFRRPLPTTNLKFNSTVMWDARETFTDAASKLCISGSTPLKCFAAPDFNLLHQANSAVRGHAEAAQDLSAADQQAIVAFEKTLFTAQVVDNVAGSLLADGARGGPRELAANDFYFGINDFFAGDYRTGAAFRPAVMNTFTAWNILNTPGNRPDPRAPNAAMLTARASIARGEILFNTRPFRITGVAGFNDELRQPVARGTCTSCHSTPNSGTHSVPRLFDTGVSAAIRRTPDMPLYTLRNKATGAIIETSDPGSALATGKWNDIGKVKTPSLRAIESRAPYFHDGSINDLIDVVRFYDRRFAIGFTPQEIADITAFLQAM